METKKNDGLKYWEGKKVYIVLKNKSQYSGEVIEVDNTSSNVLIWITITDKFDKRITFLNSEIEIIQEKRE